MFYYLMPMVDTSYICEFVLFVSVVYYRLCDYLFERNVLSAVFANQLVYCNNSKYTDSQTSFQSASKCVR